MKKVLSLFIAVAILAAATSCAKYKPVKSTKEESRTVMTMSFGDEEYEIKYELYRALFLSNKSDVDGGDSSVWTGPDRAVYIDRINSIIINNAAKIFAAFYICEVGTGFDLYSSEADKLVEEYVENSVDGTDELPGFGTYDAYLAYLKSVNMNYSVQDTVYRYYIALDKISEYYAGSTDDSTDSESSDAHLSAPIDSVRSFYYSQGLKRILYAYFSENTEKDVGKIRSEMISAADGIDDVKMIIGKNTATPGNEINTGLFLPANSFENELYDSIGASAFALGEHEVSEIITVSGTGDSAIDGLYILYVLEKSESDFEKYYSQIRIAYLDDIMGQMLTAHAKALADSVKFSSEYSSVNHAGISM